MELKSQISFPEKEIRRNFESLRFGKSKDKQVYEWLVTAFTKIQQNAFSGISVPKRLIPKSYIENYKVTNLWKYNLPEGHRLLYSIVRYESITYGVILEWMNHKEYEKGFGY